MKIIKKIEPKEIYGLGTNFYIKREEIKENYFNGWEKDKLLSEKESVLFKDNFKLFYKSRFEENTLFGFIKNEKSWHDFTAFNFDQDFKRKSINININLT